MNDINNLQIGDIKKKKESLNKTGGINTERAMFQTGDDEGRKDSSPYASRVEQYANHGPLQQSRVNIQNRNDISMPEVRSMHGGEEETEKDSQTEKKIESHDKSSVLKAQPDMEVFSGKPMENGTFTPKAKEAARRFYKQVLEWAGSFEDGNSGFYKAAGIDNVLDCLYVDGMSFMNYVREQYMYKGTGDEHEDQEVMMKNYLALIAARGKHVITLVRPGLKSNGAEVIYKNLFVDLSNLGENEAAQSRRLKEKGDQVKTILKKRIGREMTERTGMAYRKAYGVRINGFDRIENSKKGLDAAGRADDKLYESFRESFDNYNGGMQRLGLIPGRNDINIEAAQAMKGRCEEAIKRAETFIQGGNGDEKTVEAVKKAKKNLETDLEKINEAINIRLSEEGARIALKDMIDGTDESASAALSGGAGSDFNDDPGFGDEDS